ncbi:hypothetical protein niasHT_003356 [Heterodera trifolii]|uniref:Uncharacterized protein n=1 Tax=Heterodera trifolii TaxID=157864 RepID=A0ABD2LY10_9BILA
MFRFDAKNEKPEFGCDISFISESFAREANLLGNIDRSNCQTIYVPVFGGAKLLGWVNDAKIRIDELNLNFKCRLGVMEDKHLPMYCQENFDMLLGTDLLYSYELNVDFGERGITRRRKIAKFLTEEEIRRIRSLRGRMARVICAMMGIFVVVFIIIIISSDY